MGLGEWLCVQEPAAQAQGSECGCQHTEKPGVHLVPDTRQVKMRVSLERTGWPVSQTSELQVQEEMLRKEGGEQ